MEPFATVDELVQRLDFEPDERELALAAGALEDASDLVRAYGKDTWTATSAPRIAKTVTLAAALRWVQNPAGYVQSRAGDEFLAWDNQGERAGSVYLTNAEIGLLQRATRRNGLTAAPLAVFSNSRRYRGDGHPIHVPTDGDPLPYYADNDPFGWRP